MNARKHHPKSRLHVGALDGETATRVFAAAADVALVLGADGVIRGCAFRDPELGTAMAPPANWSGRAWADTLTVESRPKAAALLQAALAEAPPRSRHLNHIAASEGADIAIEYAAVRANDETVLAFGRDLRPLAALQQRLIDTQRALDREYAGLRQAQARARALFATAPEPVMIVELPGLRIAEANAAAQALGLGAGRRAASPLPDMFEPADREAVIRAVTTRSGEPVAARLQDRHGAMSLLAETLLEDGRSLAIIRLLGDGGSRGSAGEASLAASLRAAPDGVVTTDAEWRVLWANDAFCTMAGIAPGEAAGRPLSDWVGRTGVDADVLAGTLRQHGTVRLFATVLRGDGGGSSEVEISAARVEDGAFSFVIRDVGRRVASAPSVAERAVPRSVQQLTELIGRVSLKELVRDATDVIERLCIEAAIELTSNNRAAAAEMLGLSRQSLYVKLRRFGLVDTEDADGGGNDPP